MGRRGVRRRSIGSDRVLIRRDPSWKKPAINPLLLIRDRARENVCNENKHTGDAESEKAIESARLQTGAAPGPRAVKRERAEVLRSEMPRDPAIIDNRQTDQSFCARPRQVCVAGKKDRETREGYENR